MHKPQERSWELCGEAESSVAAFDEAGFVEEPLTIGKEATLVVRIAFEVERRHCSTGPKQREAVPYVE